MKYITASLLLGILMSFAVAEELTAKVLSIREYENGRISYFTSKVPIYDGQPVYDITIGVGDKQYIVRYESGTGYYPAAWAIGREIQVKKERGRFILMNRQEEVPALIVSDHDCIPQPSYYTATPQLPC
jgi:hypothetical protein